MLEITRLHGNLNDLSGVVNLSAIWAGNGPDQIVDALLKVLIHRLDLEFAAARLSGNSPMSATEMLRTASFEDGGQGTSTFPTQISTWLDAASPTAVFEAPNPLAPGRIFVVPLRIDPQSRIGSLIAASTRTDFPTKIEVLVLRIAVNQAAMALHEAQRALEQKQVALEFEQRVALRTAELVDANRQLLLLKDQLAAEILGMTRLNKYRTSLWTLAE